MSCAHKQDVGVVCVVWGNKVIVVFSSSSGVN